MGQKKLQEWLPKAIQWRLSPPAPAPDPEGGYINQRPSGLHEEYVGVIRQWVEFVRPLLGNGWEETVKNALVNVDPQDGEKLCAWIKTFDFKIADLVDEEKTFTDEKEEIAYKGAADSAKSELCYVYGNFIAKTPKWVWYPWLDAVPALPDNWQAQLYTCCPTEEQGIEFALWLARVNNNMTPDDDDDVYGDDWRSQSWTIMDKGPITYMLDEPSQFGVYEL